MTGKGAHLLLLQAALAAGCLPTESRLPERGLYRNYEIQLARLYRDGDSSSPASEAVDPRTLDNPPRYLERQTQDLNLTPEQEPKVLAVLLKSEKERKRIVETYLGKGELGESRCKSMLGDLNLDTVDLLKPLLTEEQLNLFKANQKEEDALFWQVMRSRGRLTPGAGDAGAGGRKGPKGHKGPKGGR